MTLRIPPRSKTRGGTAYVERGEGEPVVLIHGVGLRLEAWSPQIESLASTHRVIAVDMPGHGSSDHIRPGSDLPAFVEWFVGALDDLGLDSANVAGHSMGALIAGGCAVSAPERVQRVALLCPVHRRDAAASIAVRARAAEIAAGRVDPTAPLSRWFGDEREPAAICHDVESWLVSVDLQAYANAYGAFAEGDAVYADDWPRVVCPALFLTAEHDQNSTPAMARELASITPHGEAVVVANHRHMVNLTAPDQVTDALRHWLNRKV